MAENVLEELYSSEKNYNIVLRTIVNHYLEPSKKILSDDECKKIFGNVEAIFGLSNTILKNFENMLQKETLKNKIEELTSKFLETIDFFKIYSGFINTFSDSADQITKSKKKRKPFSELLDNNFKTLKPTGTPQTLPDLMINVVQRLPRYEILFVDLKKRLGSETFEGIEKTLAQMKKVNSSINEKCREAEHIQKIFKIQSFFPNMQDNLIEPHRKFLDSQIFTRIESKSRKKAHLYLFSDILVIGLRELSISVANENADPTFISYRIIGLYVSQIDLVPNSNRFIIRANRNITSLAEKEYLFEGSSPQDVEKWKNLIQKQINETKAVPNPSDLSKCTKTTDFFSCWGIFSIGIVILSILGPIIGIGLAMYNKNYFTESQLALYFAVFLLIFATVIYYLK